MTRIKREGDSLDSLDLHRQGLAPQSSTLRSPLPPVRDALRCASCT